MLNYQLYVMAIKIEKLYCVVLRPQFEKLQRPTVSIFINFIAVH